MIVPLVGWPPHCLLRSMTGVPCPFCGMTTGTLALLHGNAGRAFAANPGAPVLAIAVAVALGARLAAFALGDLGAAWHVRLVEAAGRARAWAARRHVAWPVLGAMWLFELHRFAVR